MAAEPRTAFITGAGKNIGRAIALDLAARGFNVVVNGRSDKAACEEVAAGSARQGRTRVSGDSRRRYRRRGARRRGVRAEGIRHD